MEVHKAPFRVEFIEKVHQKFIINLWIIMYQFYTCTCSRAKDPRKVFFTSIEKKIPDFIMFAPKEIKIAFT